MKRGGIFMQAVSKTATNIFTAVCLACEGENGRCWLKVRVRVRVRVGGEGRW